MKRAGVKGMRIVAAALFVFLMLFSIEFSSDKSGAGNSSPLGFKVSVSMQIGRAHV
jgi:hypothetical protein